MKLKEKLILSGIILFVGSIFNLFFTAALHGMLSRQYDTLTLIPFLKCVTGVRVADCQKGLAVFMPSMKDKAGEYRDVCFPITAMCREQFNIAVLNAYDQHMKMTEQDE